MSQERLADIALDVFLCHQTITGEIGIYEAAKLIFANHPNSEDLWDADIPATEALGLLIDEVERHVPQGAVRELWNMAALAQRDRLKTGIERRHRQKAICAFQAIIDYWQPWLDAKRNR